MFLFESSEDKKVRQDTQKNMQICFRSSQQRNQEKYKKSMLLISKHIEKSNQKVIQMVVDGIKETIKDDQIQPVRKYQSIRLLRDLMTVQIKNKNKSLGKYVVKKIFKRLKILAGHKSQSKDEDRGKDIFKNVKKDQEKYSVLFLNQLLLSIQEWAKTWPGTSEGLRKQFNEAYKQLITNGVQFPKQIVRVQAPQNYRGDDGNRSSSSPYNSVPKRQSLSRQQSKSPINSRTQNIQSKSPLKSQITQQKTKKQFLTGGLDQKQIKGHFNDVIGVMEVFIITLQQTTQIDSEGLDLLKSMVQELGNIIAKGDNFTAKVPPEQIETNLYIKKVAQTFQYSRIVARDILKAEKSLSQFPTFKNKYVAKGNKLMQSLKQAVIGQKPRSYQQQQQLSKPQPKVETGNRENYFQAQQRQRGSAQEVAKRRISVPRVSIQNAYNSGSGQPNNWVIRQKSQYNSNSQRQEQAESHEKFGSFGIGGIGQKIKSQAPKQKSAFSNRSETQKPSVQQKQLKGKVASKFQSDRQIKPQEEQSQQKFGGFQLSDENKQKKNQELYFDQPSSLPKQNQEVKAKHQRTDDLFNDSDFKEQQKVEASKSQKSASQSQSGNFFGDFNAMKEKLPVVNRNPRRQKTNVTAKQLQGNNDNPFEVQMNSQVGNTSNEYSGFNMDKPSFLSKQNPASSLNLTDQIKNVPSISRKHSMDNPFQKSLELNKSGESRGDNKNSFDDRNPNFGQASDQRPNRDRLGQNVSMKYSRDYDQSQSKQFDKGMQASLNPFQNTEFVKRTSSLSNPFEQDNKSELSQKNRSSIMGFQMNRSFTKSNNQNPFQTASQNLSKHHDSSINPFQQTVKDDFKPPRGGQKYDSVSQQASFKKISPRQIKNKDMSIDNPFQTKTVGMSQIKSPAEINQSWRFSVKDQEQNQGFDFDQFQNIGAAPRQSVRTSSFPAKIEKTQPPQIRKQIPIYNVDPFQMSRQSEKQNSIHFSQFGEQNESLNRSNQMGRKQATQKSIKFDDFDNFAQKRQSQPKQLKNQKQDRGPGNDNNFSPFQMSKNGFSGFQRSSQQKQANKKNDFSAFEVSKTSQNDFFRDSSKQMRNARQQDNKSGQSGFSGFNVNLDSKSEHKQNGQVDWDDFKQFDEGQPKSRQKVGVRQNSGSNLKTERSGQEGGRGKEGEIDKSSLKLNFSQHTSKYQSPHFNQQQDLSSPGDQLPRSILSSMRQGKPQQRQQGSVKFQQFAPLEKKGCQWNPMGVHAQRYTYNVEDLDISQKKDQAAYYKAIFLKERELLQKSKQLYNQARKAYLEKVQKINMVLRQKQSYVTILTSLRQANQNRETEIYAYNEKINKVSALKQNILQKEKLLFQKTKAIHRQEENRTLNYRANSNKWEIFNRNLKMMREKQAQLSQKNNTCTYSKTGFSYSRA